MEEEIKNKIYNIDLIVEDIKKFPQTYKTMLSECYNNGTYQLILRRKLNKLYKRGKICRTNIPGTRFGESIFYCLPKTYNILVEANRMIGSEVFIFFDFIKLSKYYIKINKYWKLDKNKWILKEEEKTIFQGSVLKWI